MDGRLEELRQKIEAREQQTLFKKAAFSIFHERKNGKEQDHRLPYRRDVDRIIHSKAYSRYSDKTQVVYLVDNDHISHRSLHVQLVSNFAKGIGEVLGLNTDLIEAIALGHDVGHPPFGHEGEAYLSKIAKESGCGNFQHPIQSCRLFSLIEPLNLGLAVYDGFLCHDGAMEGRKIIPRFNKTWNDHEKDILDKKNYPEKGITPSTLEGALVKICDTISYTGRDIEDAIALKIISREDVPKTILGNYNREILTVLAQDLILSCEGKEYITLSEECFTALKTLRSFNFKRIYMNPMLKGQSKKVEKSYRLLFQFLYEDFLQLGDASVLSQKFLRSKNENYIKASSDYEKVIDYMSGMTDNYFIRTLENLMVPKRIHI